jgi:hypothetical protein
MKSAHRHPINRMLHIAGLLLYAYGFYILIESIASQHDLNLVPSLVVWLTAVDMFIVGHVIEGNVAAMTLVILFKYTRFKLSAKKSSGRVSYANY